MEFLKTLELTRMLEKLVEGWQIKIMFASVLTFLFGEYNAGMGALLVLIVVDCLTKFWVLSKSAGGFETAWETGVINSRGLRQSLYKGLWYMSLLIATHQLEHFTFFGYTVGNTPVEITCAYLGLIELISILENLRDTGMKGLEPFINMLRKKQEQITGEKD